MGACISPSIPTPSPQLTQKPKPDALKIIALGDQEVGKTSIIARKDAQKDTIGVEIFNSSITVDGQVINLQIWDTAGQEKFRSITAPYYRDVEGVLLVYDVTAPATFTSIREYWLKELRDKNENAISHFEDLVQQVSVEEAKVKSWCQSEKMEFIGVSALNNKNISEAFKLLVSTIVNK